MIPTGLRSTSLAAASVALFCLCAVSVPASAQPDDVVDEEEATADPAEDQAPSFGSDKATEKTDRALPRPRDRRAPPPPDPAQLEPPEDANPWLTYAFMCGTRCAGPPVISHLVAPFIASWAGVGFIDSSEHYSTETKLASAAMLLFADIAAIMWLAILMSPVYLVILTIALVAIGGLAAFPIASAIFAALVLGLSAAALLATPALPTYYMVTSKRRDLPLYPQASQHPAATPPRAAVVMRY